MWIGREYGSLNGRVNLCLYILVGVLDIILGVKIEYILFYEGGSNNVDICLI